MGVFDKVGVQCCQNDQPARSSPGISHNLPSLFHTLLTVYLPLPNCTNSTHSSGSCSRWSRPDKYGFSRPLNLAETLAMLKHPLLGPVSLSLGVGGWPQGMGMWARATTSLRPFLSLWIKTGLNCPEDGCFMGTASSLHTVKCCGLAKSYSNFFFIFRQRGGQ